MEIDRVGYNIGTLLSIDSILRFAKNAEIQKNVDSLWVPESWGREAFVSLGALSQVTSKVKLGTGIISIHSRTPATVAMGISTLDILSNNRSILGLGVSTPALVENWHGIKFDNPFEKMREYIQCIRMIMKGSKVKFDGKYFKINDFKILFKPRRENIPIFTAAVNKGMVDLSCEFSDGVLLYLRPKQELKEIVDYIRNKIEDDYLNDNPDNLTNEKNDLNAKGSYFCSQKRKFEICCAFITAVSDQDPEKARERAAKTLAFYVAVGKYYARFLLKNGFQDEVETITNEYKTKGIENIHKFVSDRMLDTLTICGAQEDCRKALKSFINTGIDLPIIQINPVGNDSESSIRELLSTFSE
ncbi:MAG: LLM class flavin-dependent oxidoreductase [Nitrososphaeraceae archaeon]|nr:LLM class flavin-dependent oxidoreductase [Nitrososphaeraceae archaeon]